MFIALNDKGDFITKKYDPKDKPNHTYRIRLKDSTWIKTFCEILNYDITDQEWIYEKKLDNDGVNLPNWDKFVEWKTHEDDWIVIDIYFNTIEIKEKIEEEIGIKLGRSNWLPKRPNLKQGDFWIGKNHIKNKYPIYIISKGRYERKLTYDAIKEMGVDFKIVIETYEVEKYVEHGVDRNDILEFPMCDKKHHMQNGEGGSIPVRNFIMEHSKHLGFKSYWCLDDNLDGFYRFYKNSRIKIKSGICFRMIEDYMDCCDNLTMCGMNYLSFCPEISKRRLLAQKNTRIYSCILLSNSVEMFWRGAYNEDTDLSLRVLKRGDPTLLFNCFLCDKQTTMSCKGGNTDSIYKDDGLQKKLDSLIEQHADCVKGTFKFNKVHHQVNYKPFVDNKLELNQNKIDHIDKKKYDLTLVKVID